MWARIGSTPGPRERVGRSRPDEAPAPHPASLWSTPGARSGRPDRPGTRRLHRRQDWHAASPWVRHPGLRWSAEAVVRPASACLRCRDGLVGGPAPLAPALRLSTQGVTRNEGSSGHDDHRWIVGDHAPGGFCDVADPRPDVHVPHALARVVQPLGALPDDWALDRCATHR
jgi:hypothetical protein